MCDDHDCENAACLTVEIMEEEGCDCLCEECAPDLPAGVCRNCGLSKEAPMSGLEMAVNAGVIGCAVVGVGAMALVGAGKLKWMGKVGGGVGGE